MFYCVCLVPFLSHLIGAAVFIRLSSDDEEFSRTASDRRRVDGFFHRGHLSPAVGEGVVNLHVTKTTLPIITSNCIHLQDTYIDMRYIARPIYGRVCVCIQFFICYVIHHRDLK